MEDLYNKHSEYVLKNDVKTHVHDKNGIPATDRSTVEMNLSQPYGIYPLLPSVSWVYFVLFSSI